MQLSDAEFQILRASLAKETGIDVPESKQYLFVTRLSELLEKYRCNTFSDFILMLSGANRSEILRATIEAMTTHESGFFREPHHFNVLVETLLPSIANRKLCNNKRLQPSVRILSAGCSYGQEPYTIAMCIDQWLSKQEIFTAEDISITGIDISNRALERARQGRYSSLELGNTISALDKERYFSAKGDFWEISDTLRSRVSFQCENLAKPLTSLGKFDIIFCRNVLIYFSAEQKKTVLNQLRNSLVTGGSLFLGSTESLFGTNVEYIHKSYNQTIVYEVPPLIASEASPWKF